MLRAFVWTLLPSWHKWKQNCCCAHCHRKKNCTSVPEGGRNGGVVVFALKWESGQGPASTSRLYHLYPIPGFSSPSCCSPPQVPQGWKGPREGTDPGARGPGVPWCGAARQSWVCSVVQEAPEELGLGLCIESGG